MLEFLEFAFMRKAILAVIVLSLGMAPVGCFLVLRRLSLAGEAMSHAAIPGIALAYALAGLSVLSMTLGGLIAGLGVALLSTLLARVTLLREDASMATLYLLALAGGIFLLSVRGTAVNLEGFLFGNVLGLSDGTLVLIGSSTTLTLLGMALILRPLVLQTVDPVFARSQSRHGWLIRSLFMILVVLNLIAGFRALGTLMAVGLMIVPATAARYWVNALTPMVVLAFVFGAGSGLLGLALSFWLDSVPPAPASYWSPASFSSSLWPSVRTASTCSAGSAAAGPAPPSPTIQNSGKIHDPLSRHQHPTPRSALQPGSHLQPAGLLRPGAG